MLKLNTKTF